MAEINKELKVEVVITVGDCGCDGGCDGDCDGDCNTLEDAAAAILAHLSHRKERLSPNPESHVTTEAGQRSGIPVEKEHCNDS